MKMLSRLRYLLEEGFEVGNVTGYDAEAGHGGPGLGRITYVKVLEDGSRRLATEEFPIDSEEARLCGQLFLSRPSGR